MSKTQLQTNNTRLASLIDELKGKAAGGGGSSVETCTVEIMHPGSSIDYVSEITYLAKENDEIVLKHAARTSNTDNNDVVITASEITLNDVICGSTLIVHFRVNSDIPGCNPTNATIVKWNSYEPYSLVKIYRITIDAAAGETATLFIYDAD